MNCSLINPYVRSAAFFQWKIKNIYKSVSYHMRFFAFRRNPAVLQIAKSEIRVPAESLLILPPGIPYDFQNTEQNQWFDLYCSNFDLTQEFRSTKLFYPPVHEFEYQKENIIDNEYYFEELEKPIIMSNCPDICSKVQMIFELYNSGMQYAGEICYGITKAILFQALQHISTPEIDRTSSSAKVASKTMQYIREHFSENINEQTIAAVMNFHPYYLTRLIRKYYGTTPYQYLIQCRYDHGVRLLMNTDMSISEIAVECGFLSQSHFSKVISRRAGVSPKTLRKKGRENGQGSV